MKDAFSICVSYLYMIIGVTIHYVFGKAME